MSYIAWFEAHAKKHKEIVDRLLEEGYDKEQIIAYFDWENMRNNERAFCPLYAEDKKCHDMEHLNCYLCACPNFRFDDNEEKVKSFCSIDSVDGEQAEYAGIIHQNCAGCTVPHHKAYVRKHFDIDWLKIMKACRPKP